MTTPHIDDDQLQRYFDGELPATEARAIREALEASEEHRARLDQLGRLRELVRLAADEMAEDVGADDLYARVKGDLQAQKRREELRALEGGRRRRRVAVGTAVGLALAAAVALAMLQPRDGAEPPLAQPAAERSETALAENQHPAAPPGGPQGSEVLEVDFGANTGTVFEVEGTAGHPVAVVWIDDQEQVQ
ncbi:MAG: anti-sigma factor family protein [Myxococcota bacterium]